VGDLNHHFFVLLPTTQAVLSLDQLDWKEFKTFGI
jgi:hypothetical protein